MSETDLQNASIYLIASLWDGWGSIAQSMNKPSNSLMTHGRKRWIALQVKQVYFKWGKKKKKKKKKTAIRKHFPSYYWKCVSACLLITVCGDTALNHLTWYVPESLLSSFRSMDSISPGKKEQKQELWSGADSIPISQAHNALWNYNSLI